MKRIGTALLLLIPSLCLATDISIGGVPLAIPSPGGFSPVTPEMGNLFEMQKQFVAPMNEEYVTFIPDGDVPAALRGEIPELPRRFTVQTSKSIVSAIVPTADFGRLKDTIKTQNAEIAAKVAEKLPDMMQQFNQGTLEKYNVDLALSVSQMLPMPPHEESDRSLAYSALVRYEMNDANGNPAPFVVALTATFVHVKGKILFLYSYADEADLEWTRQASRDWAQAVIAANPSGPADAAKEALPATVAGIDWGQVGEKALGGALIGVVVGLIAWLMNRRKAA